MKQTIRSFSLGLLISGLILFTIYYFIDDPTDPEVELNEMMAALETEGYRIVTEEEYIQISLSGNQKDSEAIEEIEEGEPEEEAVERAIVHETDDEVENEPEESKEEGEVQQAAPDTISITIAAGMASSDVSDLLEKENLIDDAKAFNAYLQEHDYALKVRMGDHQLKSNMSFYEIAEALTN